jgi:plasmid maintenance system killer protein
MIASIRHKGLKRLYDLGDRSKLPADMVDRIEDILAALDAATSPADLDRPSFRLHGWLATARDNGLSPYVPIGGSSSRSRAPTSSTSISWTTIEEAQNGNESAAASRPGIESRF